MTEESGGGSITPAVTDSYATAAEYRAMIEMTDTGKDTDIEQDLAAISRYIEKRLGRFFNKDADPVARIYTAPAAGPRLWIDDLAEAPTAVKIDSNRDGTFETELASTEYEPWPLNADKGPEPRSYIRLDLTPWGSRPCFIKGDRVEITARWGWPSVPAAIKSATIQLTAILRLETPRATRRIPELGEVVEASPDAQIIIRQLIDVYRRERYV